MKRSGSSAAVLALLTAMLVAIPQSSARAIDGNSVAESQLRQREAIEAYADGDMTGYVEALEAALALNPASLWTRHNLAGGYARSGRERDALALLRDLVEKRVDMGLAADADFDPLRGTPGFEALLDDAARATAPKLTSRPWFEFPMTGLSPEGIAFDQAGGRFFFGSMYSGDVYVIDRARQVSRFASVDPQGRLSAIGMTVDGDRGLLWVVGAAFDLAENYSADAGTKSGVFGFDVETGELQHDFRVPDDAWLNDLTLSPDGALYVSGASIFRLDPDTGALDVVATDTPVFGANGIAAHPDGDTLFVSSYPVGLYAVDPAAGRARHLAAPVNTTLYGIDGLYWHDGALIGIQNGATPWRLVRLRLDDRRTAVTAIDYLEFGNPATEPMTGAIVGNRIYYIGEGPDPSPPPVHFPPDMHENLGNVVIRVAPLR